MARIINFIRTPFKKKKLIVECLSLLWFMRLSLWCLPFRWMEIWIGGPSKSNEVDETNWPKVKEIADTIRACGKFVPAATCLTQAFAARLVLERHGQPCGITIGVRKEDEKGFKAHAWIEVDGKVVIGEHPDRNRFVVLKPSRSTS